MILINLLFSEEAQVTTIFSSFFVSYFILLVFKCFKRLLCFCFGQYLPSENDQMHMNKWNNQTWWKGSTVEIFVRKFFGSMMQVHSEAVVDGWTSSWSLYRWGADKKRAWQACCRVSYERCKGKFVFMFPVSRYSISGKGCFYIFILTAFWTASHLMYTAVSIISIFYMRVFDIYPKNQLGIEASEDVCVLSCGFEIQSLDKEYVYITCTDDAAAVSGCGAPPVNFADLGGRSNRFKQLKIEAKWIPMKLLWALRNIPRYTLWLTKLRMLMGSHSSSSQEVRWLTTKKFVCKTSLDFIAGSSGTGRAWANRPSGIAITKVLRSAEIL